MEERRHRVLKSKLPGASSAVKKSHLLLVSVIASVGGFLFGYDFKRND
jgi:hypothetical protein